MTEKLYFLDAWLRHFKARVTGAREESGAVWLRLDRTAFYPEGGGQPSDFGTLKHGEGVLRVADVQIDGQGDIWHKADAALPVGSPVSGEIDWPRRFDHMQQHTGEHILANCVFRLTGGFTHGLHIGHEDASIDVTLPDGRTNLDQETLDAIENMANQRVAGDGEITCRVMDDGELAMAGLRKEPTVDKDVRVCSIGGFEAVACGGTHLARASQVGVVKILRAQPTRGKMRLFFLCGLRAAGYFQKCQQSLTRTGALLSAQTEDIPARVRALLDQAAMQGHELATLRRDRALQNVPTLYMAGMPIQGGRLVSARLPESDAPFLPDIARALIAVPGVLAMLCAPQGGREICLFARSPDRGEDVAALLKASGAVGGGKPDFAQGQANGQDVLKQAFGQLGIDGSQT